MALQSAYHLSVEHTHGNTRSDFSSARWKTPNIRISGNFTPMLHFVSLQPKTLFLVISSCGFCAFSKTNRAPIQGVAVEVQLLPFRLSDAKFQRCATKKIMVDFFFSVSVGSSRLVGARRRHVWTCARRLWTARTTLPCS